MLWKLDRIADHIRFTTPTTEEVWKVPYAMRKANLLFGMAISMREFCPQLLIPATTSHIPIAWLSRANAILLAQEILNLCCEIEIDACDPEEDEEEEIGGEAKLVRA